MALSLKFKEDQKNFYKTEEGQEYYKQNGKKIQEAQLEFYRIPEGLKKAKKHSEIMKNIPKKECPDCGRKFDPGNYKQHITKYCKNKN